MSLGRGLLAFAGGFGQGYMQGQEKQRQRKLDEEKHALEMERLRLDTKRLADEQAMRDELKSLDSFSDKPAKAFVVQSPNGQMVYTDEAMAKAHAANDPAAQVVPSFVVNGKTFSDQHEAEQAAARQSTAAARLAREASIYKKYGRNDMAGGAYALYQKELETNRQMVQQAFLDAQSTGDIKAAVDLYNKNILNGATADVQQGPNGEIVVTRTRAGQPIGQPQVFKSPEDFWAKTQELVAKAPANLFEAVKFDKDYALRERGVAVQEGGLKNDTTRTTAQVGHLAAQTADIPKAAADRHAGVVNSTNLTNAQVGHLGAQTADIAAAAQDRRTNATTGATNAETARLGLTKPSISAAPDGKGGLSFVAPTMTLDKQGNYTLGAPQVQAAPGLQYPAGYVAQQRNSLGGLDLGGAAGAPQLDPNAVKNVMEMMQQEAERRKAARQPGAGRSSSGSVTDPGQAVKTPSAYYGDGPVQSLMRPVNYSGPRPSRAGTQILHDLVVDQESGGNMNAVSPVGAKSDMQVMDDTNRDPGYGVRPARNNSLAERSRVGHDYLDALVRHFNGDIPKALAAYNAGPGAVQRAVKKAKGGNWLTLLPEETENYVHDIMGRYYGGRRT